MLQVLRKARIVEIALALASVLPVLGSLGLHPEPGVSEPASAAPFAEARATTPNASHDCPICLSHRSFSFSGLAGVVLEPVSSVPALVFRTPAAPRESTPLPHEGRAPPSA